MNTRNATIEQLAERFNQTVWVKGDLKRIYLNDEGYNTKKMSTKTFIFEKDGEFIVSCRIECPSQPYQWIQSQEEEVKESVYSRIEDFIERILDPSIDAKRQKKKPKRQQNGKQVEKKEKGKRPKYQKKKKSKRKLKPKKLLRFLKQVGKNILILNSELV